MKCLFSLLLLFSFQGVAFAAEASVAADADALKRSITSNQSMYKRFQSEYEALFERQKSKQPSLIVVSQLEQLKNQMRVLARENEKALTLLSPEEPGSEESLRGINWFSMPAAQKEQYVYATIGALEERGVFFMKPAAFYVESLEKRLREDVSLHDKFLDNLFVLVVFESETQARETLKRLAQEKV